MVNPQVTAAAKTHRPIIPTDHLEVFHTCARGCGEAPVNSNECFLKGPRGWLRRGLFTSRFWSARICGAFVCHCGWVALVVGAGRFAFVVVAFVLVVGARLVLVSADRSA